MVLSKLGATALAIRPKNWSESAHHFLNRCANAGSLDACYTLGMVSANVNVNDNIILTMISIFNFFCQIRFYCLQNRRSGLSLIAKAAIKSHAPALYSLAVIHFNGSGVSRDLRVGVALCARASLLGHIDALRELGHCIHDGYGTRQNVAEGRRLLAQANVWELAFVVRAVAQSPLPSSSSLLTWRNGRFRECACRAGSVSSLACVYGYISAVQPVNWFMREWFESGCGVLGEGLRLCSHIGCGRSETRAQEFRRCSVCGKVNYCSRGCQALDWKLRHKMECSPVELWLGENGGGGAAGGGDGGGEGIVEMGN